MRNPEQFYLHEGLEASRPEGPATAEASYKPFPEGIPIDVLEALPRLLNQLSDDLLAAWHLDFTVRIQGALRRIARFVGVDAVFLWIMEEPNQEMPEMLVSSRDLEMCPEWDHLPALKREAALLERLQNNPTVVAAVLEAPWNLLGGYLLWPITFEGRMKAILGFCERNALRRWTVWERQLLQVVGTMFRQEIAKHAIVERKQQENALHQARKAIEQAREQEIALAAEIQQTLLYGRLPVHASSISLGVVSLPSMEVDGDFYDFFPIREQIYDLVIGDVMGKGTPAALIGAAARMAFLRSYSRLLALNGKSLPDPEALLGMVHGDLTSRLSQLSAFITLVFARINVPEKSLQLINCGHPPIVIFHRARNEFSMIESGHPPLGIGDIVDYSSVRITLSEGDLVLFLSDGVTEARNQAGEMFGFDRIQTILRQNDAVPASTLVSRIRDAVQAFVGPRGLQDDFTCLAVRFET